MARRYWGSGDPFNSCIIVPPDPCARVVGVVTDIRDTPGNAAAPMRLYVSRAQSAAHTGALVVRADPEAVPAVVAAVRSFVPGERPPTIDIASERVAAALRPWSTATALFLALGGVALALASVGIYSVMNYLISERLFEMGIRLALGATAGGIVRLVLGRGVRLVLAGSLLGLAAALALGRVIESLLFQVSTFEPLIYGVATASFIVLAVGAMLPVARRAARVDPVDTLRAE
jgi:predicted lysophospholipase L1 biosynthesis ABC-type transport system permease subunit